MGAPSRQRVPPDPDQVLGGIVSEMHELVRDFEVFLTGVSDDLLGGRLDRMPTSHPVAGELREMLVRLAVADMHCSSRDDHTMIEAPAADWAPDVR
jgi:hypothetical protein